MAIFPKPGNFSSLRVSDAAVESAESTFNKSESPAGLPTAPSSRRWFALGSLLAIGLAAWLVAALLIPQASFALMEGDPVELGPLQDADLGAAGPWVHASGTPSTDALSFERMGRRGSFRLTHVEERPDVWLVLPVADRGSTENAYVPPAHFTGRLVPAKNTGIFLRPIRKMIERRSQDAEQDYILLDGASPKSYRPALFAALVLALLGTACLSFAVHLCRAVASPRPTS